ncbi:MAG: hypothetical protein F6K39_27830 [Okeania sp. SIO3B3]|nr:hypothetical protein [Okeania sp. SIO3B3]
MKQPYVGALTIVMRSKWHLCSAELPNGTLTGCRGEWHSPSLDLVSARKSC